MTDQAEIATGAREQLLDAAIELFSEHGFDGTSVRMLAERSNTNVAMVSYYFGSKEKLLEELLLSRTAFMRDQLHQLAANTSIDAWEKFEALIDNYVDRIMLSGGKFHKVMMRELSLGARPEIVQLIEGRISHNMVAIRSVLQEGKSNGIFRSDIDFGMLMGTLIGTITQVTMSTGLLVKLCAKNESELAGSAGLTRDRTKAHLKLLFARYMLIDPSKYKFNEESIL